MPIGKPTAGDAPWTTTGNAMIDLLNGCEFQGAIVGRRQRTTNKAAIGATSTRVLSVRAPVKNGRTYMLFLQSEIFSSTSVPTTSQTELRYTTDDTEPTTASTQLTRALFNHQIIDVPDAITCVGYFAAAGDGFFRVAMCTFRAIGSGPLTISADPTFPTSMTIWDLGLTIAEDTNGIIY